MVLICIFIMISDVEDFFQVLIGHLNIFFGEMSLQILCLCFNQVVFVAVLSCNSSSYSLDINPLKSDI